MILINSLIKQMKSGKDSVLATIVQASGSTPRGAGAKMLVCEGEKPQGTIGGSIIEYKALEMALLSVRENKGESYLQKFSLNTNDAANLGMICGGNVEVYFQYFSHDNELALQFLERLNSVDGGGHLIIRLSKGCDMFYCDKESSFGTIETFGAEHIKNGLFLYSNHRYYAESFSDKAVVYIFGGGHVSQKLSPVLKHIGYKHIVADDRKDFCSKEIFPYAEKTVVLDFDNISKDIKITGADYVIIMTRGHKHDFEVLSQVLKTKATYIGMIGSRLKIKKTYDKLYDMGFTVSDTERIYAPIGIDIMAETPEEIAISIAAQLIKVKAEQN